MTINRTTLLDLPLPVTGTESGTWGDIVNNGLSEYIDISVAGSLSLSADSDTNLSSTEGNAAGTNIGSTTAQYAILRCTGARTATRNINAPAWAISGGTLTNYSKIYIVVNETTGSQNIVLRATDSATPTYTTGVTIVPGERAVCAWNGSDFVKVGGAAGGSTTQIQFNNAGVFGGSANLTWDGTNVQIGATGALRLADTDSSNYVAFKSPGTVASNVTWTLPSADGTNGQALTTNGSGTLAFSSVTTSPGGSNTQVQYNNSGAFAGSANFVFDGTNVGIGTSSPGQRLELASSGDVTLRLRSSIGTNDAVADITGFSNALQTGGITFSTRNAGTLAERMRIDSSGNVGIGTSSPSQRLSVHGPSYGGPATSGTTQTNGAIRITAPGTTGILDIGIGVSGTNQWIQSCDSGNLGTSYNLLLNPNGGNLLVGTTTNNASGGVIQVSNGITFPATQSASSDANTLDDYEEGTWTPVISDGTNNATMDIQTVARYTKIGNTVNVRAYVQTSSLGSVSGAIRITGLPFSALSTNYAGSVAGYAQGLAITAGQSVGLYIQPSLAYIDLRLWDDAAGTTQMQATEWSADGGIIFSITYSA